MADHEAEATKALEDADSHPASSRFTTRRPQVHATLHGAARAAELHAEVRQLRLDDLNVTVHKMEY